MKRKFAAGVLILTACVVLVFVLISMNKGENKDGVKEYAEGRKDSTEQLPESDRGAQAENYVCVIEGEYISEEYFKMRYNAYKNSPLGYEDLEAEVMDALKREMTYKKFAEENGLTPTEEEIKAYSEETRKSIEELEEGKALIENYASGLGMTADEYWEYNEKYEAPLAVTWIKVDEYIEANGLQPLEYTGAEVEILEEGYFEKLK